ncbi:hypothetical protein V5O48_015635, partial [Marasmius crinis-equi]
MISFFPFIAFCAFIAPILAQNAPVVVCVAGQCLEGFSNTTIGTSISGAPTSVLLLPGQYSDSTNPQFLHDLLISSSSQLSPSSGFENSSSSRNLPLNLALSPGLAIYSQSLYGGTSGFSSLPSTPIRNSSTPIQAGSMAISSNTWAAITVGSDSQRVIVWDSIPDVSQLPARPSAHPQGAVPVHQVSQVHPANPARADFSDPNANLVQQVAPPATTESAGQESVSHRQSRALLHRATASTASAPLAADVPATPASPPPTTVPSVLNARLDSSSHLLVTVKLANSAVQPVQTALGSVRPAKPASPRTGTIRRNVTHPRVSRTPERTCTGATSNDCVVCAAGSYAFNGGCVGADGNGVCEGTKLIADNNKKLCDACGAKCTSCSIPNFTVASTVDQLQCTGCLPGSFLSQGKCVDRCPDGTFVDPKDNTTCSACDSSCSTCVSSSTFCLSCSSTSTLADPSGKCTNTCPPNTFTNPTTRRCSPCHPDCASCSGTNFDQCSSCPKERPVLSNGRCLATCAKDEFLDGTSSKCQKCDGSCASCIGAGNDRCLSCSSGTQIIRGGRCVDAGCTNSTSVVPGLGVCLSSLVSVPPGFELPNIPGLNNPTVIVKKAKLEWWQILLMVLGCVFIFVVVVWMWRRRMRKRRALETKEFARAKQLDGEGAGWRWRMVRFGEKFFGHRASRRAYP